jgi:RecA-family ATPase
MTERTENNRAEWANRDDADPATEQQHDQAQRQKGNGGTDGTLPDLNFWQVPAAHDLPEVSPVMYRASTWATRDIPTMRWIVEDWIPRQQVTGLYGIAASFKTWLLMQGLMAKAAGLPFLGRQMASEPTLGLFCEDTPEEIARRSALIASFYQLPLSAFTDFHWISLVGFAETELVLFDNQAMKPTVLLKALDYFVLQHSVGLIGLDTLAHMFGGEEVKRREVARFIRQLDAISLVRDCAFLFTAQPSLRGRQSGTMESGSTHWDAGVRSRLGWADPDQSEDEDAATAGATLIRRRLTRHKSNYAPTGETMDLIFGQGGFTPDAVDPDAAKLRQRGPGRDDACDARFLTLLAKVRNSGGYVHKTATAPDHYAPAVFANLPSGKGFSKSEYFRAMNRLIDAERIRLEPFGPPSRGRMRWVETQP